jgi:hypothetical protein
MWFVNLLTGVLFGSLVDAFKTWRTTEVVKYQTGVQADTQVITKTIDAQVELNKLATQLAIADKGWWVTAWMKPALFYTLFCHVAAIVFDSLPFLGHKIGSWQIPPLPHPYDTLEMWTMLAIVGIVGIKGVARVFTKG